MKAKNISQETSGNEEPRRTGPLSAAIVTIYDNINYGAILQAYALSKAVEALGFECHILKIQRFLIKSKLKQFHYRLRMEGLLKALHRCLYIFIKHVESMFGFPIVKDKLAQRINSFEEFRKANIPESPVFYNNNTIEDSVRQYDFFICGSDQIWNPFMTSGELDPIYWLKFVPPSKAKIAYAPSIGITEFSAQDKDCAREYLSDFKAISVREKHAKVLLDGILQSSKEVSWVLDPTLLMADIWDDLCEPRRVKEKYIFAYIMEANKAQRNLIKAFAKAKGLEIVTLPHLPAMFRFCDANFGTIRLYDVSPGGFISLIKNAEYVFTDSFHGSVFSLLCHKDFYVFKRTTGTYGNLINSRVYSLMTMFNTNDRVIDETVTVTAIDNTSPIGYAAFDEVLRERREFSLNFLKDALGVNEDKI